MESATRGGLITDLEGVLDCVGRRLGPTDWTTMTQEQVNAFADLTGDHNPIHVDPDFAATTMFKTTIAHGFFTLSLLAPVTQLLQVSDAATAVNYGLEKVRFPAPVPVGSQWRASAEIVAVSPIKGGVQVQMNASLEVQDASRPAVVAESVVRFYA